MTRDVDLPPPLVDESVATSGPGEVVATAMAIAAGKMVSCLLPAPSVTHCHIVPARRRAKGIDHVTYIDTQLFIDGSWQEASDARTLPVENPATGETIGHVAHAGTAELERAVAAAEAGFRVWSEMPPVKRAGIIHTAAALMRERVGTIAPTMTMEQGKPLREAEAETLAAADILDWFAEEACRVYGRIVPSRVDLAIRQMVVRDPVGPVAAFTPWNFPINQIVRKIGPALASGCSVVLKAPEETPASPAALVRTFEDAGLPAGVLNLVFGNPAEISSYLIAHPSIRKITFTGSTAVGKQLAAMAGQHMKRSSMELGGHAPVIVCEDADLDLAVKSAGMAKFRNAGQVCISPTRFLVHDSLYDRFAADVTSLAEGLAVGDGLDGANQMGALANPRRVSAMRDLTADAVSHGAEVLTGGEQIGNRGNFWQPTVLADVPTDARVYNEEPFGPVIAMRRFSALDDAIAEANRLEYGLAGYAFTGSLRNADALSRRVQVGMLWVNMPAMPSAEMPFGGINDSGYGSEGGPEALDCYLNLRTVTVKNS
ncbi:NAD-dependent succinate-semialdehyde dehydrogenase [Acuticoccus sediminis]|uniref:NAD-dependent succinate-semialdehyde dehydrogenase n=1 Tax=Acuticoccus sediminis TaxID=2184697 RepID=UPI001FCF85F1|nr:NAD-dependent succinate-semialdehyde dehydrogenase [Acuticoccus sediminis]